MICVKFTNEFVRRKALCSLLSGKYLSNVAPNKKSSKFDFSKLVLFEDNHVIVVSKPPGMLTQQDFRNEINLFDETRKYLKVKHNKPGDAYLGLVHRIDRQCSGVMVFAKTSKAASRLTDTFKARQTTKKYVAMVQGTLIGEGECHHLLEVDAVLSTENTNSKSKKSKGGSNNQGLDHLNVKDAKLSYSSVFSVNNGTVEKGIHSTLVDVNLETGRKHQIRAQLSFLGFPIVEDVRYGYKNISPAASRILPDPNAYQSLEYDEEEYDQFAFRNRYKNRTNLDEEEPSALITLLKNARKTNDKDIPKIVEKLPQLNMISVHNHNSVTKEVVSFQATVPDVWGRKYDKSVVKKVNQSIAKLCTTDNVVTEEKTEDTLETEIKEYDSLTY